MYFNLKIIDIPTDILDKPVKKNITPLCLKQSFMKTLSLSSKNLYEAKQEIIFAMQTETSNYKSAKHVRCIDCPYSSNDKTRKFAIILHILHCVYYFYNVSVNLEKKHLNY